MLQSDLQNWSLGDRINSHPKAIYLESVRTSFAIQLTAANLEIAVTVVTENGQIKMIL